MPWKIYWKGKRGKKWKTNKGTWLRKKEAMRYSKALREKKTHNVRVRYIKDKPRDNYWVK